MINLDELRKAVNYALDHEDFPEYLAEQIFDIADNIDKYASRPQLFPQLVELVKDYDTYADAGCMKNGASPEDIEHMIEQIKR